MQQEKSGRDQVEDQIQQLVLAGDRRFVELLYDRYGDALYGVVLKIVGDHMLAEDVLQDSFIKIWRKSASFDPRQSRLFTWIFSIVRNTAIDKLRSRQKNPVGEIQSEDIDVSQVRENPTSADVIDIPTHLNKLETNYRLVIEALYFQGLTHKEASEALDIPLGTVKTRLKIALRELRKIYKPD